MYQEVIEFLHGYLQKHFFDDIGIQDFSIEYYKSGGGSHIFKLESKEKIYAVRVNYYLRKNEWGVKKSEYEVLSYLNEKKYTYAPRVYLLCRYDDEENFLKQDFTVVDFVEGEDFSLLKITDLDIKLLAEGLRTLHDLGNKISDTPYVCDVFEEFANGEDKYIEKYSSADFAGIEEMYDQYNTYKQELGTWFSSLTVFNDVNEEVLCHADLKKENVLRTQSGICFIDWECAGYDIRETDIGRLFSGFQFDDRQKGIFLKEYFQDEAMSDEIVSRVQVIEVVLNFFRILDQYCVRKVVPWNRESFRDEYQLWYKTFVVVQSEV